MNQLKHFLKKLQPVSLILGVFMGIAIGATVVNYYAPTTDEMLAICKIDPQSLREAKRHENHNSYLMGDITSEKQFVEEMIKHHEAAVMMAEQLLTLNPRDILKKLAHEIITAQSAEIKMMKEWLNSWE